MTRKDGSGAARRDADGVRITADPAVRKARAPLAAGLALAALALVGLARLVGPAVWPPRVPAAAPAETAPSRPSAEATPPARAGATVRLRARPRRIAKAPPAPAPPAASEPAAPSPPPEAPAGRDTSPTWEEPPFAIGPPGSGIEVFPKPGTDPVKIGLVVPDDFEVPEGYVRHFQVTDDGQPLEPILLFHPDYEWFDEEGRPIELPADGVVPAELAPPGLPIEMLEIPAPRAEGDEGR